MKAGADLMVRSRASDPRDLYGRSEHAADFLVKLFGSLLDVWLCERGGNRRTGSSQADDATAREMLTRGTLP